LEFRLPAVRTGYSRNSEREVHGQGKLLSALESFTVQ